MARHLIRHAKSEML